METRQEVEVWHVLPAIRRALVLEFKEQGLKQRKIAGLLDITESAVSQYLKDKRAKLELPEDLREELRKSAHIIIKDKKSLMQELQRICDIVRKKGITCKLHQERNPKLKECCMCKAVKEDKNECLS